MKLDAARVREAGWKKVQLLPYRSAGIKGVAYPDTGGYQTDRRLAGPSAHKSRSAVRRQKVAHMKWGDPGQYWQCRPRWKLRA